MRNPPVLVLTGTVVAVMALGAMVTPALAQESAVDSVMRQLDVLFGLEEEDGLTLHNYIIGRLDEGQTDSWTMHLTKGVSYDVWGVCDKDCADVDLRIYSDSAELIAEDVASDDTPLGVVTPDADGRYRIELDMYACSTEPCFFGIGIFAD